MISLDILGYEAFFAGLIFGAIMALVMAVSNRF